MNDSYVYILFRETGVPFYVGVGKRNRWMEHERQVKKGRSPKDDIIYEMLQRGLEVQKKKVMDGVSRHIACTHEIMLIAAIGRRPNGPLENLTAGGEGAACCPRSKETKARISRALMGRKRSQEQIAKIRQATKDAMRNPVIIEKMRAAKAGGSLSKEHKAKIAASMKRHIRSYEHCEAISRSKIGNKGRTGLKTSEVTKQRMRETWAKKRAEK